MDNLPMDVVKIILSYDKRFVIRKGKILQINRIQQTDERYELLCLIPEKEYDTNSGLTYVYMTITDKKDYFLTYKDYQIQLQTFEYSNNTVYGIDGYTYDII